MDRREDLDRLDLDDHQILADPVRPESDVDPNRPIDHRDCLLADRPESNVWCSRPLPTMVKKTPARKFGQPRVLALLLALTLFQHFIDGFHHRDLRAMVTDLSGVTITEYTGAQMTTPSDPHPPLFRHILWLEGRAVVLEVGGEGLPARRGDVHRQERRLAHPAPRFPGSRGRATR